LSTCPEYLNVTPLFDRTPRVKGLTKLPMIIEASANFPRFSRLQFARLLSGEPGSSALFRYISMKKGPDSTRVEVIYDPLPDAADRPSPTFSTQAGTGSHDDAAHEGAVTRPPCFSQSHSFSIPSNTGRSHKSRPCFIPERSELSSDAKGNPIMDLRKGSKIGPVTN
jgi:hypothetical protein